MTEGHGTGQGHGGPGRPPPCCSGTRAAAAVLYTHLVVDLNSDFPAAVCL